MVLPWSEQKSNTSQTSIVGNGSVEERSTEKDSIGPPSYAPINFSAMDSDTLKRECNSRFMEKRFELESGLTVNRSERYDEVEKFYEENLEMSDSDINIFPKSFDDTILDSRLINNCKNLLKFSSLNALQVRAIPSILSGKHLLVQAPTGIGKTAAFLLPSIQKIINQAKSGKRSFSKASPYVLVLNNTCNLAIQSHDRTLLMLGRAKESENGNAKPIDEVSAGLYTPDYKRYPNQCDIAFGTLGSLRKMIDRDQLSLDNLELLIIDEADKMVSLESFGRDLEYIYDQIPECVAKKLQVAFFSATCMGMNGEIEWNNLQLKLLRNENPILIVVPAMPGHIEQKILTITSGRTLETHDVIIKMNVIKRLIDMDLERTGCTKMGPFKETIAVFCETVKRVNMVTTMLRMAGYNFLPLSRVIHRKQQTLNLKAVIEKKVHGIVTTNIMARGIDIESIKHIIIMEMSTDFDTYRHRIGRTGRAGHGGMATVLINPIFYRYKDQHVLLNLAQFLKENNQAVPDWLNEIYEQFAFSQK